jgi:hypothetical protein
MVKIMSDESGQNFLFASLLSILLFYIGVPLCVMAIYSVVGTPSTHRSVIEMMDVPPLINTRTLSTSWQLSDGKCYRKFALDMVEVMEGKKGLVNVPIVKCLQSQ